nr:hypothetical protein [Tanacetum cinerariifolium]
ERKPRKGQNRIKTGQKQEACQSKEKFKVVAVNRGRKTEQNAKRMARNANAVKSYLSFRRMKKRRGLEVKILQNHVRLGLVIRFSISDLMQAVGCKKGDNGGFVDKISFDLNRAPDSPNKFHCFYCKDMLRDGEACKRCTCEKYGSVLGKGHCYICGHNPNSLNDSLSISETSSQSPPNIDHCCYECGDALDGIFCQQCICKSCGKDEVIKPSVENLVPILSEFEGIPDTMCDVHLVNNPTPLEAKDHVEIVINSNDDIYSSDDNSLHEENIEYVEASPHDSELVSLEAAEIVILEVEEIEDDNLREKLLNVHLLIANIEALKENPTPSFELLTNTTTHSDISLSEYDSFIIDLTHEEFVDKFAHIISPPEYDCFYFWNLPNPGELMSVLNSEIRKNFSTTCVNLPIEDDHFPLLAYVVWIFVAYLTYPVIPLYLHPFGNEDTIFDPGITINCFYLFKPG